MNNKKTYISELIFLTLLFISAFYLWSIPLQKNPMPYSEHDGAYIFAYGDDMAYKDKTYWITGNNPLSTSFWYARYQEKYGPRSAYYPPTYNMDYAFAEIFGGARIVPAFIFIIISCTLGMFSIYLLIRKLYGTQIAMVVAISMLFSFREIMYYLWGQRHNLFAFVYIPIAIYSLYCYLKSFYEKKEKIVYLYLYSLMLLATYLAHLSATAFLAPFTLMLISYFIIKYRRLPIQKKNIKHYLIISAILGVIIVLFFNTYFAGSGLESKGEDTLNFATLSKWLDRPDDNYNTNPVVLDYKDNYISIYTIIFLIAGITYMLIRRRDEDWVIIIAIVTLYLMFHLHFFGLSDKNNYRIARFLMVESYFFYTALVVGILTIPDYFKIPAKVKRYIKYVLIIAYVIILVSTQGIKAYNTLSESYPEIMRITPNQLELANWIEQHIPPTSALDIRGTLTYPKARYIQVLSRRVIHYSDEYPEKRYVIFKGIIKEGMNVPREYVNGTDWIISIDYIIFDYSDLMLLGAQADINQLQQMEKEVAKNATLLYDKNNIKVYRFD